MTKSRFLIILLMIISANALAQRDIENARDGVLWDRFYFGGGGGFAAGSSVNGRYTSITVNPVIGFMTTEKSSVGTTFTYQNTSYPDVGFSRTSYGINPFMRYNFNQLFFQLEYNYVNVPVNDLYGKYKRGFYNRLLVGPGLSRPTGGKRGAINALVMYDLLYKQPSVFNSPLVVRVFFTF